MSKSLLIVAVITFIAGCSDYSEWYVVKRGDCYSVTRWTGDGQGHCMTKQDATDLANEMNTPWERVD